jgi:hypothetical protein
MSVRMTGNVAMIANMIVSDNETKNVDALIYWFGHHLELCLAIMYYPSMQ